MYDGSRVRWELGIVLCVTATAPAACFRGDFLDNTCERLPGGCVDATTSSSSTATTDDPTTAPAADMAGTSACVPDPQTPAIEPPAGATLEPGPAFRITKLQIVDPNFYYPLGLNCFPVSGAVGSAVTDSLASWETNLVFLAQQFDPAADEQALFFVRDATCNQNANYCAYGLGNGGYPMTVINDDDHGCDVEVIANTFDPEDIKNLGRPSPPCFRTPQASFEIALVPDTKPLRMWFAQFAAKYEPDDCNPEKLVQGVMTGFITREDALAAMYFIDDYNVTVNLWQVILGSDANTCEIPPNELSDVDAAFFPDPVNDGKYILEYGVYIYLNIEAERLPMYKLD